MAVRCARCGVFYERGADHACAAEAVPAVLVETPEAKTRSDRWREHRAAVKAAREKATGRPRLEDREKTNEARRPWEAAGMSRRTWYRRMAEKKDTDK